MGQLRIDLKAAIHRPDLDADTPLSACCGSLLFGKRHSVVVLMRRLGGLGEHHRADGGVEVLSEMPIRAAPYRHQKEAFTFVRQLFSTPQGGGAALLMEMGTGKTITSVAIAGALWNEHRAQRLLVVAPLSILGVWEDEFRKFAAFDYALTVLKGATAQKIDAIRHMGGSGEGRPPVLQVLVVNYESALCL